MQTLDQIAQKYQIDTGKENFPLNTIRLLYLVLIETLAINPEQSSTSILTIIPLIREIIDKRLETRLAAEKKNLKLEFTAVEPTIQKILPLLPQNSQLRATIEQLFSFTLPIQEALLFGIVSKAQSDEKVFSAPDVNATLNLRSMDSLFYSQALCELIGNSEHNLAIHNLINLIYQLNDLVDSIIFAKEDTTEQSFSAFEVIRKSVSDSVAARELIKSTASYLINLISQVELPETAMLLVNDYAQKLISVLGDDFLAPAESQSATQE